MILLHISDLHHHPLFLALMVVLLLSMIGIGFLASHQNEEKEEE